MKTHTSQFKNNIKEFGRELDDKITYTIDGVTTELGNEQLNSVSPHYEGAILKSVMKQLDIDSNVEIPVGTELNYQFGVKVGSLYEYIDYGNYIVKDVEKQEDTYSYKITCYDKMLYAMKEYENLGIRFPITIKDYLEAICTKVGLTYEGSQFANSDKTIENELFLDADGRSMGYTFRDVLDEIAQVSGGTICINKNDELEVRYIHDVGELQTMTGSDLSITNSEEAELQSFELEGNTTQANTPTPSSPSDLVSVGYTNLLDISSITSKTLNGISIVRTDDYLTLTDTRTSTGWASIITFTLPIGTYTFSYVASGTIPREPKVLKDWNQQSNTFTVSSSSQTYRIAVGGSIGDVWNGTLKLQIEKGTKAHDYIICGKYGIEIRNNNKNLFDKNDTFRLGYIDANGSYNSDSQTALFENIPIYPSTNYIISFKEEIRSINSIYYDSNNTFISRGNPTFNVSSFSFTTPSNCVKLSLQISYQAGTTMTSAIIDSLDIQLEIGNQATTYETHKENTYQYILDEPLRAIGNYKDKLYIENGYLYVDRAIGSQILNGTQSNPQINTTLTNTTRLNYNYDLLKYNAISGIGLSNRLTYYSMWQKDVEGFYYDNNAKRLIVRINKSTIGTTTTEINTWLSNNNIEFYYVLATPYTEELGVVDTPSTYEGITYIDAPNTINVSYITQFEEIDEEYLKDVNVNFGEKFGVVNTLVLSRGGDGDKISLSIPSDLADENKVAIQISENQIMNGNDRDEYMSALLSKLYGLEYYINDFSSTGIGYLDLCDRYRVKIGDTAYKCIMFNDEANRTQGFEEFIYTDMQEENEQEYKYMSSTDRGITQANIIAKKSEATILEYTQQLDEANNRLNAVETKQTDTDRTISILSTNIDIDTGDVNAVTTKEKRFTFNDSGLNISSSDNDFTSKIDEQGVFFEDGNTRIAEYTKDGSKQKDLQLFGVYYYGMDDIDDTPMFVAQLYTDNNGDDCVGHFYNGGDY